MKLIEFKIDGKKERLLFDEDSSLKDIKEYIKEEFSYCKVDMRSFKKIKIPMGRFECEGECSAHFILYDGEEIVRWYDDAAFDYPEDLTWSRDIGTLISAVEKLKELEFADRLKGE